MENAGVLFSASAGVVPTGMFCHDSFHSFGSPEPTVDDRGLQIRQSVRVTGDSLVSYYILLYVREAGLDEGRPCAYGPYMFRLVSCGAGSSRFP